MTRDKDTLKEEIFEFLKRGAVSFAEIEDRFGTGNYTLELKHNTCLWFCLPIEVINKINELRQEKSILFYPADSLVYLVDGRIPKVPIAKSDREYKSERWLPVVLWRTDMIKGLMKTKEANVYRAAGWDV